MNYLRAKREKQKIIFITIILIVIIGIVFIFRAPLGHASRLVGNTIMYPITRINSGIRNIFAQTILRKTDKQKLIDEINLFKEKFTIIEQQQIAFKALQADYLLLQHLPQSKHNIISAIVSRPPIFGHDTLLLAVGNNNGVSVGDIVFLDEYIAIGKITEVFQNKSIAHMYSFSGEITPAIVSDSGLAVELVGNGGGNFEITLPKDTVLTDKMSIVLPKTRTVVVGLVGKKISNEHDSFTKYLVTIPFNIQNVRFVSIEKNNE